MSLDDYLRRQHGRCPDCGVDLKHQAELHVGGCLTTAQRLGVEGMAVASSAAPSDEARVLAAIRQLAATRAPFSANEVRELTDGIRGPVVGAAFSKAKSFIRPTGQMVRSTDPRTHGHRISEWVGRAA
jgi:hypothetical protein